MPHLDIANRLAIYGYKKELEDFDAILADEWWRHYESRFSTVETLLHHPTQAIEFVQTIRYRVGLADFLEEEVLLRLTNIRKSGFLNASKPL